MDKRWIYKKIFGCNNLKMITNDVIINLHFLTPSPPEYFSNKSKGVIFYPYIILSPSASITNLYSTLLYVLNLLVNYHYERSVFSPFKWEQKDPRLLEVIHGFSSDLISTRRWRDEFNNQSWLMPKAPRNGVVTISLIY